MSRRHTCSDCGRVVERIGSIGRVLTCSDCMAQPPKEVTLWAYGGGNLWVNGTAGGKPVKYVRADLPSPCSRATPPKGGGP
jgi:hypothetical protein